MSEDKTQPAEAIAELAARLVEQVGGPVHEEILLIAGKVGELSDRFAKIEGEFTAQTAPLDAAKANQDASIVALNAAIAGIKALNFHVLDNNLGAVSKRLESETAQSRAEAKELAAMIGAVREKLSDALAALDQKLSRHEAARVELAKKHDDSATQLSGKAERVELQKAVADLMQRLESSRREFAEPRSFNPRGKYDAQETYARLDVVTLNGTSYVSTEDGNAEKPSKTSQKWQVLASRGGGAALGGGATDITGVAGVGATGLQLAQAGAEDEARAILGVSDVVGATASVNGAAGRVPQPDAGEQGYFLRGDGTWAAASVVTASLATSSEAIAGTNNEKYISPLTLHAYANPQLSLRAPAARMASDGATTNRALIAQFGTHGNVAGSACTFVIPMTVPTSNPSANATIAALAPVATDPTSANNALVIRINTSGALVIRQETIFGLGNVRLVDYANFRSAYSGQTGVLVIRFPEGDSTTDPVITWNGTDITSSFALTTTGTPPNWMGANLVATYFLSAYNWPASDNAPVAYLLNYDVGADEALRLSRGEPFAGMDLRGGSMVPLVNATTLNGGFESEGAGGNGSPFLNTWRGANVTVEVETSDVFSGTKSARLTGGGALGTTAQNHLVVGAVTNAASIPGTFAGARYLVRFAAKNVSGGALEFGLSFAGTTSVPAASAAAWATFQAEIIANSTDRSVRFAAPAGAVWLIDSVELYPLGLLDCPILQPTLATDDATRQGMSRRLLGMTAMTPSLGAGQKVIPVRSQSYTAATSVQVLGGPLIAAKNRLVSVRGTSSAPVNLSLGTTSGGTQLINAQAVNGDFDISTFASRIIASGASLYFTFSGNTTAAVKITLEDL